MIEPSSPSHCLLPTHRHERGDTAAPFDPSFRLPTAVIHLVLSFLNGRELCICAQVCCELYECCDYPPLWEGAGRAAYPHAEKLGTTNLYSGEWKTLLRDRNRRNRSVLFEWEVTDCLRNTNRRFSPTFTLGAYSFQLIVDPSGNPYVPLAKPGVSVYLTCSPTQYMRGLAPSGRMCVDPAADEMPYLNPADSRAEDVWECAVAFTLAIVNQTGARRDLPWSSNLLHDRFRPHCREWGVHRLVSLRRLQDSANGYLSETGSIKVEACLRLACSSLKVFTSDGMREYAGFGLANVHAPAPAFSRGGTRSFLQPPPRPRHLASTDAFPPSPDTYTTSLLTTTTALDPVLAVPPLPSYAVLLPEADGMEEEMEEELGEESKEEAWGMETGEPVNSSPTFSPECTADRPRSNRPSPSCHPFPASTTPFWRYEVFQCMTVAAFRAILAKDLNLSSPNHLRLWIVTQPWADSPAAPRELIRTVPLPDHPALPDDFNYEELPLSVLEEHQTLAMALGAHMDCLDEVRVWAEVAGDGGLTVAEGGKEGGREKGKGPSGKALKTLVPVSGEAELDISPQTLRMLPDPTDPVQYMDAVEDRGDGGLGRGGDGAVEEQGNPESEPDQGVLGMSSASAAQARQMPTRGGATGEKEFEGDARDDPGVPRDTTESGQDVATAPALDSSSLPPLSEGDSRIAAGSMAPPESPTFILLFFKRLVPAFPVGPGKLGSSAIPATGASLEFSSHALLPIDTPVHALFTFMAREMLPRGGMGKSGQTNAERNMLATADPGVAPMVSGSSAEMLRCLVETPPNNWQPASAGSERAKGRISSLWSDRKENGSFIYMGDNRYGGKDKESLHVELGEADSPRGEQLGREEGARSVRFRCLNYHPTKTISDLRLGNGHILSFFQAGQEDLIQHVYCSMAQNLLRTAAAIYDWTGPSAKVEETPCPINVTLHQRHDYVPGNFPRVSSLSTAPWLAPGPSAMCLRPRGSRLRPRLTLETVVDLFEKVGNQRFRVRNTFFEQEHTVARQTLDYGYGRHLGFCCDRCGELDFTGPRYKCCACQDFDLCHDCHLLPVEGHRYRFKGRSWAREDFSGHTDAHAMVCLQPIPSTLAMLRRFSVKKSAEV